MDKQKKLKALKIASKNEDEDKVNEILEQLEDEYHIDLTKFYGVEFDSKKINELNKKLGK